MEKIEDLTRDIINDMDELTDWVSKQMDDGMLLSMDSEEFIMFQKMFNMFEKTKEFALLMAKKMDRQEEILCRLDRYLDEEYRSKAARELQ